MFEKLKHNKKRNVGLLNEFFARYIAKAIIEHRDPDVTKAKELFAKHFQKGTDIHRELKLFSALLETHLTTKEAASSLLEQVKVACKLQSQSRLDLEKTALLHEINTVLEDSRFFDQKINEYQDYASIQLLLNHWRGNILTENLSEVAQLEDKLINRLTQKGTSVEKSDALQMKESDVDGLVVNLMIEKLNQKFSSALNEDQKKLLQLYVFSKESADARTELSILMEGLRVRVLGRVERSLANDPEVKKSTTKFREIQSMLSEDYQDTKNPDDRMVTFYMTVSKLEEELNDE